MILDFHTHIFSSDVREDRTDALKDGNFNIIYRHPKSRIITHEELAATMKDEGVHASVAMGFPWFSKSHCESQNRYLRGVMKINDSILPFGSVPLDFHDNREEIDGYVACLKDEGFIGIGEIGFYHDGFIDRHVTYLSLVLDAANRYSMPVCIHVNEPVGHPYSGKCDSRFADLYRVLSEHPDVTVILSHWGGGLLFYELMPEVHEAFTNVYYDTAASPYLYKDTIYRAAVDITGPEKILFGSDFPLIRPSRYVNAVVERLRGREQKMILGENAQEILGITGKGLSRTRG